MSETSLYYTLSTVSQTLAGALGMLAAFLALRVAALEAVFRANISELETRSGMINAEVRPPSGGDADTLEGWRKHFSERDLTTGNSWNVQLFRRAERNLTAKRGLLRHAVLAFIVSATVMALCFVGLAITPWLSDSTSRAEAAAGFAVVGGIACLVGFGWIVRAALLD
jgi:hypothetical protein